LELLGDPLLEKVFYNFIDNSIAHGEKVTRVRLYTEQMPDCLGLVYEDDGVGISPEMRDHLFEKGMGKNNGLGMFLSREILAITGMTISENGTPGKGARFVISVPLGNYRWSKTHMPEGDRMGIPAVG